MKRYLLFTGDKYYPLGGWQDYKASFETVIDALKAAAGGTQTTALLGGWDWWQIVDIETGKMVEEGTSEVLPRSPDQED